MSTTISEKINFTGSQGDKLAARLELPAGKIRAYALFAHCFTCSKDIFAAKRIAEELAQHGIAVLRFDFTGLGNSGGDFANTNFSSNVDDLVLAADYLRDHRQAPAILVGHSLGGAAVLAAAPRIPESVAVATIGAPSDPGHVTHLFDGAQNEIEKEGVADVCLAGRPFRIKSQFLEDISENKLDAAVGNLGKALLIFHSPLDATVGIANAAHIFKMARHPKSFISLDNADHLLTRRVDAEYVSSVLSAWSDRFIQEKQQDEERVAQQDEVIVEETGTGKFTQAVYMGGRHEMFADEPQSYGGNDQGPSPYDLLLAGLGACTSMTLRMYADLKKIPLERVAVTLNHDKIHAEDCLECETTTGKIDRIQREIELSGDLDGETRERLLGIADKCPVHKTLHSEVRIESRLKR